MFKALLCTLLCSLITSVVIAESESEPATGLGATSEGVRATFIPPDSWRFADTKILPEHVHIMVVGKGKEAYPPSINLATEEYGGTLNNYLEIVRKINDVPDSHWKSLGNIATKAGDANLSQVDTRSEWGEVRMMHTILLRDGIVYIMTASALKSEFPHFYKEFFASMRSLNIEGNALLQK
jgi:hypothetical protein